nr:GAF domain-containing protein [Sphingomonas populi]
MTAIDKLARDTAFLGDVAEIRAILSAVCERTGMGFAAVARVTEQRWIACQVADKIDFGLEPGDELDLKSTICDEIRENGKLVVIDHVAAEPAWRTHHTPALYGFESYVSIPILLADGSFFGTLCAIDPAPRALSSAEMVATLRAFAEQVATILSVRIDSGTTAAPGSANRAAPPAVPARDQATP